MEQPAPPATSTNSANSEKPPRNRKKPAKQKLDNKQAGPSAPRQLSEKLRGHPNRDSPEVRVSKTLSWILRHGAKSEGLAMRPDGFVKVTDLLANPKLKTLDLAALQEIVKADAKQRYDLVFEEGADSEAGVWWMKANQGHSIKAVKLDLVPISSASDLPTGIAVHGTTLAAWESISTQGLSKMKRNHIHLAQGVVGENVISGVRGSSQVFIFIDVQRVIDAGLKFFLSNNGVILTEGDERGFLGPQYFLRMETSKRVKIAEEGRTLTEGISSLQLNG
ncbi:KptA family-domain-containing protein [Mycena albidolilacea]|uniref:2'-phosphotransferase n=1 Tax=Mycena albidolilacea TaxID=1033008 RepID=A0AAD7AS01_9AGAR|nr:KptA family-domain-containing protein [Mycena albidolilacea]